MGAETWEPEIRRKAARKRHFLAMQLFQCCTAVFRLLQRSFLVKMTSAVQKSECCSATSAAQHSENCSATSVFACAMLQGWGLEGWGLGLADSQAKRLQDSEKRLDELTR